MDQYYETTAKPKQQDAPAATRHVSVRKSRQSRQERAHLKRASQAVNQVQSITYNHDQQPNTNSVIKEEPTKEETKQQPLSTQEIFDKEQEKERKKLESKQQLEKLQASVMDFEFINTEFMQHQSDKANILGYGSDIYSNLQQISSPQRYAEMNKKEDDVAEI